MSRQSELNFYIRQLQTRLRVLASLRGAAILAVSALGTTVILVLVLNAYAFPEHSLPKARIGLLAVLLLAAVLGLVLPLLRLDRRRSVDAVEASTPAFNQRLLTFHERQTAGNDPFLELLAGDTLTVAGEAAPSRLVPNGTLLAFGGAALGCVAVLVWTIMAGPGFLGYGASLLWTGPKHNAVPFYAIHVTPGDAAVRRNSDQLITAEIVGLQAGSVQLFARYQSALSKPAKGEGWEPVTMRSQAGGSGYQFLLTGIPEDVEYYVQVGRVASPHYKVRVVDLPSVKGIQVTYHYPKWTGLPSVSEEHSGDLRAIEGTEAELHILTDKPVKDGLLSLDGAKPLHLTGGEGNVYQTSIHMEKDGAYHVAALDGGQQVRLSEDFFIATNKADPPSITIDRPGADYRASPIEEVTIGVKASDDFALHSVTLHYSVNGGPDRSVNLLKQPGAKDSSGKTTLSLEDFKLVPGDVVSLYATAKDGHAEARTEISFIQADPFEREFSQSQEGGGGGGGGGGGQQQSQTDISKREKELIAATWKQQNNKAATPKESADTAKFLSAAQDKLRDQVLALSGRMQTRDLSSANEEFTSFEKDMQAAAAAMAPTSDKLKNQNWQDAIPTEQKALQALLRAEATFRQIQVAFGQKGGGGGGGGGSAGRDLASLFDLELDTQKNQYESAQTGSAAEQQAKAVDDALQKLDALARRQEELAQQQQKSPSTFQERWQQEMLRREAEQLQRQMEQLAQNSQPKQGDQSQSGQQSQEGQSQNGQAGQNGQTGQSGQSGQSGQESHGGQQGQGNPGGQTGQGSRGSSSASGSSDASGGQGGGSSSKSGSRAGSPSRGQAGGQSASRNGARSGSGGDPRVEQALDRLRLADGAMKRGAGPGSGADTARRAAEDLRQASNLLSGTQKQQASGKLDSLAREAQRLREEQQAQADRIRALAGDPGAGSDGQDLTPAQMAVKRQERGRLAEDRQRLSDDLSHLEKGLRDAARELAPNQPASSSKLRDALGGMDQADLTNRVQRTADWLRRGINPNSNGTETSISKGLQSLSEQVRGAQQGLGSGKPERGNDTGRQTAALDHVDRLRTQLESLTAQGPGQPGHRQNQAGQPGQAGNNSQSAGQPGQSGGQAGASGRPNGQRQPGGPVGTAGMPQAGEAGSQAVNSGDLGGRITRGGDGLGTAWNNINTGNNRFDSTGSRSRQPDMQPTSDRAYQGSLGELHELRNLAKTDPAALKAVQDLIRTMEHLDPSRFPGNPAMVEQLHAQILSDVDRLELQLRRSENSSGQVRTSKAPNVPPQYQDAVADYFRRLSKPR